MSHLTGAILHYLPQAAGAATVYPFPRSLSSEAGRSRQQKVTSDLLLVNKAGHCRAPPVLPCDQLLVRLLGPCISSVPHLHDPPGMHPKMQ